VGRLHVLPRQPARLHHELWDHVAGCRQYFNVTRDTVTYEILETYKIGEAASHRPASKRRTAKEGKKYEPDQSPVQRRPDRPQQGPELHLQLPELQRL
jgi:hypothetical protein